MENKKNAKTNNKLTKEAKKELNIVSNLVANNKTTKKDVIKEAKPTKDTKVAKEAKHNDKEVKVNNEVKEEKKEKITLNGRVSPKKQMHLLEEYFDGTLDSIIFPTNNGQITGYSIFIAIIFIHREDKLELLLQLREKYPVLFERQMQYLNKSQLQYVKNCIDTVEKKK